MFDKFELIYGGTNMLKQSEVKEAVYRDWVLHNKFFRQYCEKNKLNIELLKTLKVDYLPNRLVFFKPSDVKPMSDLSNDIETQPKAILGVVVDIVDGDIKVVDCERTDFTNEIEI